MHPAPIGDADRIIICLINYSSKIFVLVLRALPIAAKCFGGQMFLSNKHRLLIHKSPIKTAVVGGNGNTVR